MVGGYKGHQCVAWLLLSAGSAKGWHAEDEGKFLKVLWLPEAHSSV